MLAFMDVASHILATIAVLAHVAWTQITIRDSNFKKKRRNMLSKLAQKTYGSIAIIAVVISFGSSFLMENSDGRTIARVILNLLVVFAHLFAARLMVRFIKGERERKTKAVTNSK